MSATTTKRSTSQPSRAAVSLTDKLAGCTPVALSVISCRFWEKVNKHGPWPKRRRYLGRCWVWKHAVNEKGYGRFSAFYVNWKAHRFVYELEVGPIPHDLDLDHLCDNTACVRPSHLEPVTNEENQRRRAARVQ